MICSSVNHFVLIVRSHAALHRTRSHSVGGSFRGNLPKPNCEMAVVSTTYMSTWSRNGDMCKSSASAILLNSSFDQVGTGHFSVR